MVVSARHIARKPCSNFLKNLIAPLETLGTDSEIDVCSTPHGPTTNFIARCYAHDDLIWQVGGRV